MSIEAIPLMFDDEEDAAHMYLMGQAYQAVRPMLLSYTFGKGTHNLDVVDTEEDTLHYTVRFIELCVDFPDGWAEHYPKAAAIIRQWQREAESVKRLILERRN